MAINFKLTDRFAIDPATDPMRREWVGYRPSLSAHTIFEQNRGMWYLNAERAAAESYATFSYDGTIVAVAALNGVESLPWPDPRELRAPKSAVTGHVLQAGDVAHDYFRGRSIGSDRNPVSYIEDPPVQEHGGRAQASSGTTYWCLLANPETYDVERAMRSMPVVLWNLGRLQRQLPTAGDPVLVWRTKGRTERRGLIGRGVVDGDIALVPDDRDPFWADPARRLAVDRRVPIRWRAAERSVWLDDAPTVLGALKVSRSQGLSMVVEDPETWEAAARLLDGAQAPPQSTGRPRGQGWMSIVEQRLAVERAAMEAAIAHYTDAGYDVDDVHAHEPYDIRCTRGAEEIHVEVKGTTTDGADVLLTHGEVRHARRADHAALFVLPHLQLDADEDSVVAIAREPAVIIDPWVPAEANLEALSFRYTLPASAD